MNLAAVSARRGRHCLAPPGRCPCRRRRRGPVPCDLRGRCRVEKNHLDAVAAIPTVILRTRL